MPVKINLLFHFRNPAEMKEIYPERVHALFFSILPKEIAEKVHSYKSTKPFTICFEKFFKENRKSKILKLKLKATLLDDSLFPYFSQGIILENKKLAVGPIEIRKRKILSVEHKSYEELIENAGEKKDFLFYFKTPTSFKKTNSDYPLPEPVLIFKSLLKKWNKFSPFKYKISVEDISCFLLIGGAWIKTKKFSISPYGKAVGFYGRVFINVRTNEKNILRKLNILFNFSPFSGIGRKTTMGMGNVEIP